AAAVRAGGGIHLAWAAVAVRAAAHRGLARGATFGAARRGVHQPFAGIELLLANREHEVTAAVATPQRLIGGQTGNSSSGPVAPQAAGHCDLALVARPFDPFLMCSRGWMLHAVGRTEG